MSYDREAFIDKIYSIYAKKKEIEDLQVQRNIDEKAIAEKYKVVECNAKRNKLMSDVQKLINPISEEIVIIEKSLLEI